MHFSSEGILSSIERKKRIKETEIVYDTDNNSGNSNSGNRENACCMRIFAFSRPKIGEDHNGDDYFVEKCGERVIVAVIDALGHGEKAEEASRIAIDYMMKRVNMPIDAMIRGMHNVLKGTRGAVVGISVISGDELSFAGVGNISAQIANERVQTHLPSISGVIGWNLRHLKVFSYHFTHGWLVMNSDGIGNFIASEYLSEDLRQMAMNIMDAHGKDEDDATIVILKKMKAM